MNKIKYNIAVSGASGFIGRALITKLIKEGHQVFGLVRNKITCYDPIYYKNILVEDISKNIVFDEKIKIDILYHLAAKTHSKSNNYKEYYDVNVLGLKSLLNILKPLKIKKIIMLSSIKVNGEGFLNNDNYYSEMSKNNPLDNYGISKLEAENLLKTFCIGNNINFVILRPPLVYGAGVKGNLKKLMYSIDKNIPLPIIKTANNRSLISLRNLVSALIIVALNDNANSQTYLVSDDLPISVENLYKNIAIIMKKKLFLIKFYSLFFKILLWPFGKAKLVEKISSSLIIDNAKIKKDTEWRPAISLMDDLKSMVESRKN
ncbi:MAG: NAD-dependent epimerase/dehydratase family protein [Pelagibacterales bacterium]|nr:NAD-dependent epimerase/dehydratase family protein [Pelagibacterales bacterium]